VTLHERVPVFAAALWWGSLTAIGLLAVPLLFANAATPAVAGNLAAKLFSGQTWLSLGCGLVLLMWVRRSGQTALLGWLAAGMLFALLGEFAVAPRIVARQNLALWHTIGSGLYLAQWVCAGGTLWKLSRPAS